MPAPSTTAVSPPSALIQPYVHHELFGTTKHGRGVPVTHATTSILLLAGLLAAVYLLAASLRLPPAATVLVTALAFLVLSMYELGSQLTPIPQKQLGLPSHNDWVDRVVGRGGDVTLVGGSAAQVPGVRETAFWNVSVTRVYYTCERGFGTDFGEQPLTTPVVTRYAVVPTSLRVAGRVIARDPTGKLNLVAPAGNVLLASGMRCGS